MSANYYFGVCPCDCAEKCQNSTSFTRELLCLDGWRIGVPSNTTDRSSHNGCFSSKELWLSTFYKYPVLRVNDVCGDNYNDLTVAEIFTALKDNYTLEEINKTSLVYYGTCPCNSDTLCRDPVLSTIKYFSPSICPPNGNFGFIPLEELTKSSCLQFVSPSIATMDTTMNHKTPTSPYSKENNVMDVTHFMLSTRGDALSSMKTTKPLEGPCNNPGHGSAYFGQNITCFRSKLEWHDLLDKMPQLCGEGNYNKTWLDLTRNANTSDNYHLYYGICPCKCATTCSNSPLFVYEKPCLWNGTVKALKIEQPAANTSSVSTSTTRRSSTIKTTQSKSTSTIRGSTTTTRSSVKKGFTSLVTVLLPTTTDHSSVKSGSKNNVAQFSPSESEPDLRTTFIHGKDTASDFLFPTEFYHRGEGLSTTIHQQQSIVSISTTVGQDDLIMARSFSTVPNILHSMLSTMVASTMSNMKTTKTHIGTKRNSAGSTVASKTDMTVSEQGLAQTTNFRSSHQTSAESAIYPAYTSLSAAISTSNDDGNKPTLKPFEESNTSPITIRTSEQGWHGISTTILRTERTEGQGSFTRSSNVSPETSVITLSAEASTTRHNQNSSETPLDHTAPRTNLESSETTGTAYKSSSHSTIYEKVTTLTNSSSSTETQETTISANTIHPYNTFQKTVSSNVAISSTVSTPSVEMTKTITNAFGDDTSSSSSSDSNASSATTKVTKHDNIILKSTVSTSAETGSSMPKISSSTLTMSAETESFMPEHSLIDDKKLSTEVMNANLSEPSIHTLSASSGTTEDPSVKTSYLTASESSQETPLTSASEYGKSPTYSNKLNTEEMAASTFSSTPRTKSTLFSSSADSSKENVHMTSSTAHASVLSTSDYESSGTLSTSFTKSALRSKQYSFSKSDRSEETKAVTSHENRASSKNVGSSIFLKVMSADKKISAISTTSKMPESKSQRMMEMGSTESSFESTDSAGARTSQTASATSRERLELSTTTGLEDGQWTETFASTSKTAIGTSVIETPTMPKREFTSEASSPFSDGSSAEAKLTSSESAIPSSEQTAEFTTETFDSKHKAASLEGTLTRGVTEHREVSTEILSKLDEPVSSSMAPISSLTFFIEETDKSSKSYENEVPAHSTDEFESTYKLLFSTFTTKQHTNFASLPLAYRTCQEDNSMMADEVDLRNSSVLEILDFLREIMNPVPERFFVNEQNVRSSVESASVRIVSRSGTSRLHLAVVETASPDSRFDDVYALCRTTKYCADMYCNLQDYEFYEIAANITLPPNRTKLDMGEEASISCDDDGVLRAINVTCSEEGLLLPHPTYMNCSLNELNRLEAGEVETSYYTTLQKSCEDCHGLGTSRCLPVEGGYTCICKPHWTGFTCWKSPNQCLLQQLQCEPGGKCVSEVDRAYCSCYEGYGGSNCEIVKEKVSFAQNESFLINAASAGAAAMTSGEIFVMAVKGLMKLYIPKAGKGPTLLVGIVLGGFVTMIACDQYYEIATTWSCLGQFTTETSNFWLPVVLVNACAALTASYYAYISFITMKNIPQYREKMNNYLRGEDFMVKWSEEKVH
ncbi:unnamed protein product [Cylicocyclus nassatus]|uniref:EGF-like domain-containing protein n=1 Tax=Cylicocyclus nassatus TaxID=53992 RepID=A0AA36GZP5_CYLNA|nr:unnamed protein product [Cylicocyclus nassatus]